MSLTSEKMTGNCRPDPGTTRKCFRHGVSTRPRPKASWGMARANSESTDISWGLLLVRIQYRRTTMTDAEIFKDFPVSALVYYHSSLLSDSFQYPLNWLLLSPAAISSVACSICCVKAYGIRKTQRGGAERLSVLVRQVHALNHVESTPIEEHVDG